jgi:VWFA-related protein
LKLIQVYVTDKKGNPVTDLKKEDFTLYDNGELHKIIGFETHFLALTVRERESLKKIISEPEQDLFPQMNRKFFLLFDAVRNTPFGINKSKTAALHFLDTQIKPKDEVAVLSFNAVRFLVLHQYLTKDHDKIRRVIKEMKLLPKIPGGMPLNPSTGIQIISGKEHLSSPSYS